MRALTLQHQTMFRELVGRCLDAGFDADFPENGSFTIKTVKEKAFWYYQGYTAGREGDARTKRSFKYVGPKDDPEVTRRVEAFRAIKDDYAERRRLVAALRSAGLPSPDALTGDVVEALWKAGVFRLRGVLVGTAAFQSYAGLLGVVPSTLASATDDVDIAQFRDVSIAVDDSTPALLEALQAVDPTFSAVPHQSDGRFSTRLKSRTGFKVEFLTPNRSSDDHAGKPAPLPALSGMAAEPLRFLDYLIYETTWSALLHKGGIPVRVPAPARFAIHKLIVAYERRDLGALENAKARKDQLQAAFLIDTFQANRQSEEIGHAWIAAYDRGPRWREGLLASAKRLAPASQSALRGAIALAAHATTRELSTLAFD